jgi:hypothetical protein
MKDRISAWFSFKRLMIRLMDLRVLVLVERIMNPISRQGCAESAFKN